MWEIVIFLQYTYNIRIYFFMYTCINNGVTIKRVGTLVKKNRIQHHFIYHSARVQYTHPRLNTPKLDAVHRNREFNCQYMYIVYCIYMVHFISNRLY